MEGDVKAVPRGLWRLLRPEHVHQHLTGRPRLAVGQQITEQRTGPWTGPFFDGNVIDDSAHRAEQVGGDFWLGLNGARDPTPRRAPRLGVTRRGVTRRGTFRYGELHCKGNG